MHRCHLFVAGVLWAWFATFVVAGSRQAEAANTAVEWNVLLHQWHVAGPLPQTGRNSDPGGAESVPNEASLTRAMPVEVGGKQFAWIEHQRNVLNFPVVLGLKGKQAEHRVAYAATEVSSPAQQAAKLSLGYDDTIVAWLNGKEVFRDDKPKKNCVIDQRLVAIELQKGANTLLLKVGQETGDWQTVARLLSAAADKPLGVLLVDTPADSRLFDLPTLSFDLLDKTGKPLATIRSDAFRTASPAGIGYPLHVERMPEGAASVRVQGAAIDSKPVDQTFPLADFVDGRAKIVFDPAAPLAIRVVDEKTGGPLPRAVFRVNDRLCDVKSDEHGAAIIEDYPALLGKMWVAAPGYLPKQVAVERPSSGEQTFKLAPGGYVLKGRVLTKEGQPLAGATVRSGWCAGYQATAVSDENGNFEVPGCDFRSGSVYPTVVAPGFVAKDGFAQKLDVDGVTDVEYRLETGAVVTGRVVNNETGEPIAGVTITAGHDRFASNNVNPEATTDADGKYRLAGVEPGQMLVHAFSDDYAPAVQPTVARLDREATVDFQIERGADVAGLVIDPQGKPIGNVWLVTDTWNGARMFLRETRSAEDGSFKLAHMPSTPVEVHVMKQNYVSDRNFQATPGDDHKLILKPELKHRIRIRLADAQEPPEKLSIHRGYQFPGNDRVNWQDESYLLRQYNAKQGVVKLSNSEPSSARMLWRFRVPGYRDGILDDLSDATEAKDIDLVLERTDVLKGVVVSPDDAMPLGGVHVLLVNKQDRFRPDHYVEYQPAATRLEQFSGVRATTNDRGEFELPKTDHLADSAIVLLGPDGGFAYIEGAAALFEEKPCELPLPMAGVVEGRVTAAGEPEADADVRISWIPSGIGDPWDLPWGCGGQVTTDAEGRFRFEGLGPGRYGISRSRSFDSPGRGSMSMYLSGDEVVLLPGASLQHDLARPAGHEVAGQTLDADGKPLGDCVISVTRADEGRERIEAVRADAEGRFIISHLPDGNYELSADHYATQSSSTCGLGDQDFSGKMSVSVPAKSAVELKLSPSSQSRLTAGGQSLVGSVPPDFTATPLDDSEPFTLSEKWGKVVAIDFWATWCGPCMAVMPQLKELHEKYKDSDDVVFITVSLDQKEEDLRRVMKREGLEFPVFFADKGWGDALAKSFGVTGIPSSFVIGRDGRFAADKMHGAQLAAAVDAAVKLPRDTSYPEGTQPARLAVNLTLEGGDTGPPCAKLTLIATDAAGKTVREDKLTLPGESSRIVWLYPPLAKGGKIHATAEAEGLAPQEQAVESPEATAELKFSFTPPRVITGTVMADGGKTPAKGMTVSAQRNDGFQRTAEVGDDGRFRLAALPGTYRLAIKGNEQFAPVQRGVRTSGSLPTVEVPTDADPQPTQLEACVTRTITGVLLDADGQPVPHAEAMGPDGGRVPTDKDGKFELKAAPSEGEFDVYGIKDKDFGKVHVVSAAAKDPIEVTLGQGMDDAAARGPRVGQPIPEFEVIAVDTAQSRTYRPPSDSETLLVFSAMWHPAGREFVQSGANWARDHSARLQIISCDWSLEQAKREADEAEVLHDHVLFAPYGIETLEGWRKTPLPFAAVVSRDGTLTKIIAADDWTRE